MASRGLTYAQRRVGVDAEAYSRYGVVCCDLVRHVSGPQPQH